MKWGQRKTGTGLQIRVARIHTSAQKSAIRKSKRATKKETDPEKKAELAVTTGQLQTRYLKNPNRIIAARLTSGEKAVVALLGLTGAGIPLATGVIAGTSARSRRIEYKQENKRYG